MVKASFLSHQNIFTLQPNMAYIDNLPLQQHFHFVGDVGIKATNY